MYRFLAVLLILFLSAFITDGFIEEAPAFEPATSIDQLIVVEPDEEAVSDDTVPEVSERSSSAFNKMMMEKEAVMEEPGFTPDFTPVTEELIPLKTRIISISARNTPLKDVLYTVGENTGLNIVMETGVDADLPMTITLKEVAADEALNIIFSSIDYFYDLNGNVLIVRAMDTMMFEFGHPSFSQTYSSDVGGDLFGATEDIGSIKGGVTQSIIADSAALNLWDSLTATLNSIIGGKGKVDINRMSGTILVTSTKKSLKRIEEYLTRLKDVLGRRVLVEARIVEVTLTDNLKYGIDWTFLDNLSGFGNIVAGTTNFADNVLVITEKTEEDPLKVEVNTEFINPNFFLATAGNDFRAIISALDEQGDTEVLSNPRLSIMNGQTAVLSVGRKSDYISEIDVTREVDEVTGDRTTEFDVTTNSVLSGVMLGILPNINDKGEVTLTITPIVSDLVELKATTLGSGVEGDSFTISLPIIDLKELSTVVKVRNGEMVIIGGHIDKTEGFVDKKVPFLGDIPLIGYLFRKHEKTSESKELVILLKATVDQVGL